MIEPLSSYLNAANPLLSLLLEFGRMCNPANSLKCSARSTDGGAATASRGQSLDTLSPSPHPRTAVRDIVVGGRFDPLMGWRQRSAILEANRRVGIRTIEQNKFVEFSRCHKFLPLATNT